MRRFAITDIQRFHDFAGGKIGHFQWIRGRVAGWSHSGCNIRNINHLDSILRLNVDFFRGVSCLNFATPRNAAPLHQIAELAGDR